MATVAVAAAGAAIGWGAVGTAAAIQIGWAVGSAVGMLLFAPDGPDIEGPRLNDLNVQSSSFGRPIPETWGTMRQAGQIIDSTKIKETKHEEDTGGKGGGGGTQTTYTYSITMAISFGVGPVTGVRRMWANGNLIWTRDANADAASISASVDGITVYDGSETQEPDPTLESLHGVGNVPAYRGICYAVFDNLQLEDYGNRPPHIEAEVVRNGSSDPVNTLGTYEDQGGGSTDQGQSLIGLDDGLFSVIPFRLTGPQVLENQNVTTKTLDISGNLIQETPRQLPANFVSAVQQYASENSWTSFERANAELEYHGDLGGKPVWYSFYASSGHQIGTEDRDDVKVPSVSHDGKYLVYCRTGDYSRTCIENEFRELLIEDLDLSSIISLRAVYDPEGYLWSLGRSPSASPVNCYAFDINTGAYSLIGSDDGPGGAQGVVKGVAKDGLLWATVSTNSDFFGMWTATVAELLTDSGNSLSTIVSDLCQDAELSPSDIDVSALTDTVPGYTRAKVMSARKAIEPLQSVYYFDAVESDWALKFVPRGGASVATITEDELAAHPVDSERPDNYMETRQQEVEIPREISISHLDVNADYTRNGQRSQRIITESSNKVNMEVPLAETADKVAQVCDVLLYDAWLGRNRQQIQLPPKYEYLDPTDVITVNESGNTHVLRIVKVQNGGVLKLDCVAEEAGIYTSSAEGHVAVSGEQTIGDRGPTNAVLLDIPILRDADNDAGYYAAANGYLSGWTGSVLYKSSDGGETYDAAQAILSGSVIGTTTDALADGPTSIRDRANSVNVSVPQGELSSITDGALLDGSSNAAAIGSAANGWEILQFRDVTLEADGTYTLSHFIRGKRGTEWATGIHATGDTFVLLSAATLERPSANADNIGASRLYKAVTTGKQIAGATAFEFTNDGVGLEPYSPAHLEAKDNGNGTFDVSWIRRGRIGGEWRDYVDVPLGEDSELYRVKVFTGGVEQSSTDVSTTTATVTASAGDTIKVAQVSATVGAGYYAEVTV